PDPHSRYNSYTHTSTLLCLCVFHQELDLNRLDGDTAVCPPMRNGQDDLPGFDLITQFQLDVIPLKGVRKVEGSTPLQVAYRLDREANFQIPTRLNFPRGFPDEYSVMVTFRMIKNTVNKVWNVWQVVDEDGRKQAGLRLNGDQQALEYFLMGQDGNLQTVTFPGLSVLFNTKWHKVMIGVERDQVTLYVDCQAVDKKPIKGKGPVNTEGDTLIGRLDTDADASVVFELQWMLIHCDPKRANRENCQELPITEPDPKPIPGPPGPTGPEGPRGPHGEDGRDGRDVSLSTPSKLHGETGKQGPVGVTGDTGIQGDKGDKGDTGEKGLKGHTGYKGDQGPIGPVGPKGSEGEPGLIGDSGVKGDQGPPGVPGIKGEVGEKGMKGYTGEDGRPGQPGHEGLTGPQGTNGLEGERGLTGSPGPRGLPGPKVNDIKLRELCSAIVEEHLAEFKKEVLKKPAAIGAPGMTGLPGPPGPPGPAGTVGDAGPRGLMGMKGPHGYFGLPGTPGKQGDTGVKGDTGHKGEKGVGTPGSPGEPGPQGVAGSPGIGKDGKDGPPGKDGVNGSPGASGPRGATGAPGYCDPSDCIGRPPPLYMMNGGKKSSSYRKGP
uniref:Collagen alpha-1(IX) chain n=1 Tax=Oncorhynchus tshawytscha TaxID=74940 RepID=A0A8C8IH16_ONCTS